VLAVPIRLQLAIHGPEVRVADEDHRSVISCDLFPELFEPLRHVHEATV